MITSTNEYRELVATLLCNKGYLEKNLYAEMVMMKPDGKTGSIAHDFRDYHINSLIDTMGNNRGLFDELADLTPKIDGSYADNDKFDEDKIKKNFERFNHVSSSIRKVMATALEIATETMMTTVLLPQGATIAIAVGKHTITPIIKHVFLRDPNNKTAFMLHHAINKICLLEIDG
jgi:hypothetical protein